jgi:hypothetical protein
MLIVTLLVGGGCGLTGNSDRTHVTRRIAELTPVSPGDLAAVKRWIALRCRGRTVAELSAQLGVEPSMEAVVERMTRAIREPDRHAARMLCERELNRSARNASN